MKRFTILLLMMLSILSFTIIVVADEDWLPKDLEPPTEFDASMIVALTVDPSVTDIPVYPGTTTYYLSWTVNQEWYTRYPIVNLVPQANGYYNITVWFSVVNPSSKWAYALHMPNIDPDPYQMVKNDTFQRYWNCPGSYLRPYAAACPWNSYCINVVGIRIIADVVASGKFKIYEFGNQLRTDVNKDGIVNIKDLYLAAIHYGESYPESPFNGWDILLDNKITYEDLIAIAVELGRNIPP